MSEKIKIGIVTWIGNGNFGTTLQAFALQWKLRQEGFDAYIVAAWKGKSTIKYVCRKLLGILGFPTVQNKAFFIKASPHNGAKIYGFIREYIKIVHTGIFRDLQDIVKSTDVFMSGSDQIWNVGYKFNPFMFLDFAGDKQRVAYASSIGLSQIPPQNVDKMRRLLSRYSHIGVRERTAVKIVSELLNRNDVTQVLDPTFLLDSSEWERIGSGAKYEMEIPEEFILCYLIGKRDNYEHQLCEVKRQSGIDNVIILPAAENAQFTIQGAINYAQAGPCEFVDLIRKASLICTDSFHATAVSINFSKNFVEFMRFDETDGNSQNSRIYDLLGRYGLARQIYKEKNESWLLPIQYNKVQRLLSRDRADSWNYLINAINK